VSLWHPSLAPKIQTGSSTTDTSGNASITFTTPFPTTPKVFVQGKDASARGIVIDIVSVSQTGFTVKARKVTGITTSSSGSHSHSFTPSGTIATAGAHSHTYTPSGSISSTDLGSVDSGLPSATITVASDPIKWVTLYAASSSGGSPTAPFQAASTDSYQSVASSGHVHNVVLPSHSHTFTGTQGTTDSAGDHSHTFTGSSGTTSSDGAHSHTFTGTQGTTDSAGDHSHTFTGSSGTTSSTGAHTHTVDAPVLQISFDWIAVA